MIRDIVLNADAASPELLPVGYLVGDVNSISVSLRGTRLVYLALRAGYI